MTPDRARCPYRHRPRRLDSNGRLKAHTVAINVSARAVRTVGHGRVRRQCGGTGQEPTGSKPTSRSEEGV